MGDLDAVLLGTDLGSVLVTTPEQTVLLPRCDRETLTALAREQRMQRILERVVTARGRVGS